MPMVPAPASTAGMVNTPVPTMLPMTSPVAEVSPSAWAFSWFRGDSRLVGWRGLNGRRRLSTAVDRVVIDIGTPFRGSPFDSGTCRLPARYGKRRPVQ